MTEFFCSLSHLNIGEICKIKRIGKIRKPFGRPQMKLLGDLLSTSRRICNVRSIGKELNHLTIFQGHPCTRSHLISYPGRAVSSYSLISSINILVAFLCKDRRFRE